MDPERKIAQVPPSSAPPSFTQAKEAAGPIERKVAQVATAPSSFLQSVAEKPADLVSVCLFREGDVNRMTRGMWIIHGDAEPAVPSGKADPPETIRKAALRILMDHGVQLSVEQLSYQGTVKEAQSSLETSHLFFAYMPADFKPEIDEEWWEYVRTFALEKEQCPPHIRLALKIFNAEPPEVSLPWERQDGGGKIKAAAELEKQLEEKFAERELDKDPYDP